MSTAQDFISKSDRAKLEKQMADKQVEDATAQLTEDQKAQVAANAASADAKLALTAVVATVPDGVSTDDGRYFEVERGELREAVPVKASAISGELAKDDQGNYVFTASAPGPDVIPPPPAPPNPEPGPSPEPAPAPSPSPEPPTPAPDVPSPEEPPTGFADKDPVEGGGPPQPTPGVEPVMARKPPTKSGFVA